MDRHSVLDVALLVPGSNVIYIFPVDDNHHQAIIDNLHIERRTNVDSGKFGPFGCKRFNRRSHPFTSLL